MIAVYNISIANKLKKFPNWKINFLLENLIIP